MKVSTETGLILDIESPTQAQVDAYDRLQAKARRETLVESITVEAGSKVFNGDEVSQTRMARAIVAMQATGTVFTQWTLANNTVATVSLNDLVVALAKAGQRQTELWAL